MTRIAVLGANGQVASEVCLRLREAPGIEIVPVARNFSGSAFLRLNGLECRHGLLTDAAQARALLGDCDVIANFALSNTGHPRVDRVANRQIARNVINGAKAGATIVFFSTIEVYAPALRLRFPGAYGMEKLLTERLTRRLCRRSGRPCFVLRLGHVLGDLQNITLKIRREIQAGPVLLPHGGAKASNSVFTASVAEAVHRIAQRGARPGTYDMMSSPQWSWVDVYAFHAMQLGLELRLADAPGFSKGSKLRGPGRMLRAVARYLSERNLVRERVAFLLGFMSEEKNHRMHMRYLQARALREINELMQNRSPYAAPDWRELRVRSLAGLSDPRAAMQAYPLCGPFEFVSRGGYVGGC